MLWERGAAHERTIMDGIGVPLLDLSAFHGDEKERLTTEAMLRRLHEVTGFLPVPVVPANIVLPGSQGDRGL
jgi:hypothetical protein